MVLRPRTAERGEGRLLGRKLRWNSVVLTQQLDRKLSCSSELMRRKQCCCVPDQVCQGG